MTHSYQIRITGDTGIIDEESNKVSLVINATNNTLIFNGINGFSRNITSEVVLVNEA